VSTDGLHAESVHRSDVSRHDVFLLALPLPLLAGAVWGVVAAVPLSVAVGVASLPSIAALTYGLFVEPPVERDRVADVSAREDPARDATSGRPPIPADD
jgi:predicted transporter